MSGTSLESFKFVIILTLILAQRLDSLSTFLSIEPASQQSHPNCVYAVFNR